MSSRPLEPARRGVVLVVVVLGVILITFIVAFYVGTMVRQETRLTATFIDGVTALNLAEAGVDQAFFSLKRNKAANRELRYALEQGVRCELLFTEPFYEELNGLLPEGKGEVRVRAIFQPTEGNEVREIDITKVRMGRLTIQSRGIFTNPQKGVVSKQVRVTTKVLGTNLMVVAPDHGFFCRDQRVQFYHVPSLTLDARDFSVKGGKVYIENGMDVELTEYLMNKEFRPLREVGFLDMGYDVFNFFTLFNGGVNFTRSEAIEFWRNGVQRRYFKWQGLEAVFGPQPAWLPITEPYRNGPIVRQVSSPPSDESVNLFKTEEYKKFATLVLEPSTSTNPAGNPEDNRFFTDVFFPGPLDMRNTIYRNVLPLYGWGDWRRVPPWVSPNPTRRDDLSNSLNIDGVTFVRGDVFLEGWYHGVGTLVVQGNVYLGGKVLALPPQLTGAPSLLNIIAVEDREREIFGADPYNKVTGRVIYKPHHDQDFDRSHLKILRELSPFFDGAIYTKNGMEVDRTSFLDLFFNFEVEFNWATDLFDWQRISNDVFINGTDPRDILFGRGASQTQQKGFNPSFAIDIERWEEESPTL